MTELQTSPTIYRPAFESLALPVYRDFVKFAEDEVVVPDGPRQGRRFRVEYSPWMGLVLNEYTNPQWRRFFIAGSVQSGKTLLGFMFPILYYLFEVGTNVIIGAPDISLAQTNWQRRMSKIIDLAKFSRFMPKRGRGSQGGRANDIAFENGTYVIFMGAGGSDAQRSSHPAQVVVMTEIDKMDKPGAVSRETDPVSQLEARTTAFSDKARIFAECTVSVEDGRIWREVTEIGSNTRVFIQCPFCKNYVWTTRENFVGWDEAKSVIEAKRNARYKCNECEKLWDEKARQYALAHPALVHRGQEIDKKGKVHGPVPETETFGLRWTGMHSALLTLADLADKHWRAMTFGTDDAEKEIAQFVWATPYKPDGETEQLTSSFIQGHAGDYAMGEIPEAVEFVVMSIDVQKNWIYWLVNGYKRDMTRWTLAFGTDDIVPRELRSTTDPTKGMVLDALESVYQIGKQYDVNSVWCDSGFKHKFKDKSAGHNVREWCAGHDDVYALVGRGHDQMTSMVGKFLSGRHWRVADGTLIQARRQADRSILWFVDVDTLKVQTHNSFRIPLGEPGCHYLPAEVVAREHRWYARHICAEQYVDVHKPGKGIVKEWIHPIKSRWDMLDCEAYNLAGALYELAQFDSSRAAGQSGWADLNAELRGQA